MQFGDLRDPGCLSGDWLCVCGGFLRRLAGGVKKCILKTRWKSGEAAACSV